MQMKTNEEECHPGDPEGVAVVRRWRSIGAPEPQLLCQVALTALYFIWAKPQLDSQSKPDLDGE